MLSHPWAIGIRHTDHLVMLGDFPQRARSQFRPRTPPRRNWANYCSNVSPVTAHECSALLHCTDYADINSAVAHFAVRGPVGPDAQRLDSLQPLRQSGSLLKAHSQGSWSLLRLRKDSGSGNKGTECAWEGQALVPGWSDAIDLQSWPEGLRESVSARHLQQLPNMRTTSCF